MKLLWRSLCVGGWAPTRPFLKPCLKGSGNACLAWRPAILTLSPGRRSRDVGFALLFLLAVVVQLIAWVCSG